MIQPGWKCILVSVACKLSCSNTPVHVHQLMWKIKSPLPKETGQATCVRVCVFFEGWQGTSAISLFWGLPADRRTGPPLWNVIILSWALLWSGCYFISTFCLRLNVNDALSAIYGRSSSPLQPYINIQHPSRPITHFRPGKIVTSFIGQILSQFPTAVCFHLRGSLSSSFHLSQHYSSGLPIKMIPIFITPENAGSRLSRKTYFLAENKKKKRKLPATYQKAGFSLHRNIWKCETSRAIIATLQRWERRLPAISNVVQSRPLIFHLSKRNGCEWNIY